MRLNLILAGAVILLTAALAVVYTTMSDRVRALEARLDLMDANLTQFAMPMDDLRQDIAAIYVELDSLALADEVGDPSRQAASASRAERRRPDPAPPGPAVNSIPSGPVHYGMTTVAPEPVRAQDKPPGERIAIPVDEED